MNVELWVRGFLWKKVNMLKSEYESGIRFAAMERTSETCADAALNKVMLHRVAHFYPRRDIQDKCVAELAEDSVAIWDQNSLVLIR